VANDATVTHSSFWDLLNRAGGRGKDVICVGTDKPDRADYDNEDHRQYDRVLGDVLAFVGPNDFYQLLQATFILPQ
jgi:hypothetical protein